jgi:hypothetical protein
VKSRNSTFYKGFFGQETVILKQLLRTEPERRSEA